MDVSHAYNGYLINSINKLSPRFCRKNDKEGINNECT